MQECERHLLVLFADLLRYPAQGADALRHKVRQALSAAHGLAPVVRSLSAFAATIQYFTDDQLEELYTRTFDVNPSVTLDVGYHLFGLAYKRGDFLVAMQRELRAHDIERGSELADHLPLLLTLATKLDEADAGTFIEECLMLPVARMSEGFAPEYAGYGEVLRALDEYLRSNHTAVIYMGENHDERTVAGGPGAGA